ncbi:MAG: YeeE/YedE family protein [Candidatus Hodarchaeota archaeon]
MALFTFDVFVALAIGSCVGIILQRGRVCSNTAFRNLLLARNSELMLIIIFTIIIELIGYQLLAIISIPGFNFRSNPIPFSFVLLPIGSFLFGVGTVIAGGCAGGVCYRVGEGSIKSLLALLGFAIGIGILTVQPLSNFTKELRDTTSWMIEGKVPSLELFFPRWIWTLSAIILLFSVIYYYKQQTRELTHLLPNWTPIVSGVLLGILGIIARFSSTLAGREFGFSTTDGIGELFTIIANIIGFIPSSQFSLSWAGFFIIGLILGAALSSFHIREFKIKIPAKNDVLRFFGGGFILGIGAILALGCNFGHILGGIPELGLSSFFALLFMIFGNWFGSYIIYTVLKQSIPESTPSTSFTLTL